MKLELSPRLEAIAGLVPEGCGCLADIGTDHGYVPVSLLLEGRIRRAVAADIGALPLDHARRTAEQYGVAEKLDFRLGDGLSVLSPGEAPEWGATPLRKFWPPRPGAGPDPCCSSSP